MEYKTNIILRAGFSDQETNHTNNDIEDLIRKFHLLKFAVSHLSVMHAFISNTHEYELI